MAKKFNCPKCKKPLKPFFRSPELRMLYCNNDKCVLDGWDRAFYKFDLEE